MRFGVFTSMGGRSFEEVRELWIHLEATGWDIACVTDHFMPNTETRDGPVLEGWTTLSALANTVPDMRVGTIVLGNTYRHPAVLAKMAAQLDIITNGRLLLGMGAGWQQNEHEAYGLPFYTIGERLARLDEACEVMRSLWTQSRSNYDGRYYELVDAPLEPKPVQSPYPELMIGGGGEKVTLRIVAQHADHWNVWGGPQVLAAKGAILNQHCERRERDPKSLRRSANMALLVSDKQSEVDDLAATIAARMGKHAANAADTCLAGSRAQIEDKLEALLTAGVDTLFVPTLFRSLTDLRDDMDVLMNDIAPAFRDRWPTGFVTT